jgi:hypothetical protein
MLHHVLMRELKAGRSGIDGVTVGGVAAVRSKGCDWRLGTGLTAGT